MRERAGGGRRAVVALLLLAGLAALQGAAGGLLTLKDGYLYDPDAAEPWLGRGFAYRAWAWEEGEHPTATQVEWDLLAMREAGANSARVDVHWAHADAGGANASLDFSDYALLFDAARRYGVRVIAVLRVDRPPEWAPGTPGAEAAAGGGPEPDPGWYALHPPGAAGGAESVGGPTGAGRRAAGWALGRFAARFGGDEAIAAVAVGSHLGYRGRYGAGAPGGPAALAARWGVGHASFEAAADSMPPSCSDPPSAACEDLGAWRASSVASFAADLAAALRRNGTRHLIGYEAGTLRPPVGGEDIAAIAAACSARGAALNFTALSYVSAAQTDEERLVLRWGIAHAAWASGLPVLVSEIGYPGCCGQAASQGPLLLGAVLESLVRGAAGAYVLHWSDRRWLDDERRTMGVVEAGREPKAALASVSTVFARIEEQALPSRLPRSEPPKADFAILVPSPGALAAGGRLLSQSLGLFAALGHLGMEGRLISSEELRAGAWRGVPLLVLPAGPASVPLADLAYINSTVLRDGGTHVYAEGGVPPFPGPSAQSNATALFGAIFGLNVSANATVPRPAAIIPSPDADGAFSGLWSCEENFASPVPAILFLNSSGNGTQTPAAAPLYSLLLAPLPPANATGVNPSTFRASCGAPGAYPGPPFAAAGVGASIRPCPASPRFSRLRPLLTHSRTPQRHGSGARALFSALSFASSSGPSFPDRTAWYERVLLRSAAIELLPRMRVAGSSSGVTAAYRVLQPGEWLIALRNWLPLQADDSVVVLPGLSPFSVVEEAMDAWNPVGVAGDATRAVLLLGSVAPSASLLLHAYPRDAWEALPPAVRLAGAPATVAPNNYDLTVYATFTPRSLRVKTAPGDLAYPPMFSITAELVQSGTERVVGATTSPMLVVDPSSKEVPFLNGGGIDPVGYRACTTDGVTVQEASTCALRVTVGDADAGVNGIPSTADGGRYHWRLRVYSAAAPNGSAPIASSPLRPWATLAYGVRPVHPPGLVVPPSLSLTVGWRYDTPELARAEAFPPPVLLYNSSRTAALYPGHLEQVASAARRLEAAGYRRAGALQPDKAHSGRRVFHVISDSWSHNGTQGAPAALGPSLLAPHFKVLVFPGTLAMSSQEVSNLVAWLGAEPGARLVSTSSCVGCLVDGARDDRVAALLGFSPASRNATSSPPSIIQLLSVPHPAFGDLPPGSRLDLLPAAPGAAPGPELPFYTTSAPPREPSAASALVEATVSRARRASALVLNFDATSPLNRRWSASETALRELWAGAMAWARWPEGAPRLLRWELKCNSVPLMPVPVTFALPAGRGAAALEARPSRVCGVPIVHLAFLYPFPPEPSVAPYDQRTAVYYSDNDSPYPSAPVLNDTAPVTPPTTSNETLLSSGAAAWPTPADVLELDPGAAGAGTPPASAFFSTAPYVKPNETCRIEFEVYPPYGTQGLVAGRVHGLNASRSYQIAFYFFIDNLWASRPTLEEPSMILAQDGSFELASLYQVAKDSPEQSAAIIAAFVYPADYDKVAIMAEFGVLPDRVAADALCNVKMAGREPGALHWADTLWIPKLSVDKLELPGPAFFYNKKPILYVSDDGKDVLHLNINKTQADGTNRVQWYSSEIVSHEPLGYGNYTFWISGVGKNSVEELDNYAILGLFTYDFGYTAARPFAFRELDFEFGRWGYQENTNFQIAVQPYVLGKDFIQRFRVGSHNKFWNGTEYKPLSPRLANVTCHMMWTPNYSLWTPNYTQISVHEGFQPPSNVSDDNVLIGGFEIRCGSALAAGITSPSVSDLQ
eukprot:tig00000254_g22557.t1